MTRALDVAVAGKYAYVVDGHCLFVIDISDAQSPKVVGSYKTPAFASGVAVAGDYAYVADGLGGLRVVDISSPSAPKAVGFYDTPALPAAVAFKDLRL